LSGSSRDAIVAIFVGLIALSLLVVRERRTSQALARRTADLRKQVEETQVRLSEHRQAVETLRGKVGADAADLGLPSRPSWELVEGAQRDLLKEAERRQLWEQWRSAVKTAREKLDWATQAANARQHEAEDARSAVEAVERAWLEWKSSMSLTEDLSPEGVLDFFRTIEEGRTAAGETSRLRAAIARLEQDISGWESRARDVVGLPRAAGEELVVGVLHVATKCDDDRQARMRAAQIGDAVARRAPQIEQAAAALLKVEAERDLLFENAGASDEADFRNRLAIFSERSRLKDRIREAEQQLVEALGIGSEAERIRQELAAGKLSEWQDLVARTEAETKRVRSARDDALLAERQARDERHTLEQSADVIALELKREGLVDDLTNLVREWQVISLAKGLIQHTLDDFVRNRQPEVLEQASPTFMTVTGDRYERVLQAENRQDVLVMDATGGLRSVGDLSGGTAEQLYVCIRLALAGEFAKAGADLPLVMDEVLVNFDPVRAGAVVKALVECASERQILVFTCQPQTRDLFLAIDPSIRVVEIQPVEPVALPDYPETSQESPIPLMRFPDSGEALAATDEGDVEDQILSTLEAGALAISEIVDRTGFDEPHVRKVLNALREAGRVDLTSHGRGARWHRLFEDR